ncbi:MAG: hypothetical protein LBM93_11265 [Oscillospiraceae bacterium]|jgi:tryptophanase|nr:hypothetical protein [Oscillospiraceae bacterium]
MNKLIFNESKSLRLTNALFYKINIQEDNIDLVALKMENYIKSKGVTPVGPLIQHTTVTHNANGQQEISLDFIRQCNNFIDNIEMPYQMESVVRIKDCLYVRYIGEEAKLKVGYEKISVEAFEKGIEITGDSYTIFVDKQDDILTADIFVEKKL